MRHDEVTKRLNAYADNEVGPDERKLIDAHLAECSICMGILNGIRELSALVRESEFGRVNTQFVQRLHKQIDDLARRGVERVAWGLVAAAACVAIVAGTQFFWNPQAQPQQTAMVVAPAAWEGAAVEWNNTDDVTPVSSTSGNNNELAVAQWMVTDLSQGSAGHD